MNKITLESDINEYEQLMSMLREACHVIDIFRENYKINPYTFGVNGEEFPQYDRVLIDKEDFGSFQTLDYVFEILHKCEEKNLKREELQVKF
jgi:hypothetical protein